MFKQNKKKSGFTIIELMIVLTMIGILSAVAVPRLITWLPGYRLKSAASDLQSNMQKARIRAVKENRSIQMRFDNTTPPGFYYFDMNSDGAHDANEFRVDLANYQSGVAFGVGSAPSDWSGSTIASPVPAAAISFGSRGTANQNTVYLQNINAIVCYAITTSIAGSSKVRKFTGANWN